MSAVGRPRQSARGATVPPCRAQAWHTAGTPQCPLPEREEAWGEGDWPSICGKALLHPGQGLENRCLPTRTPRVPPGAILKFEETPQFQHLLIKCLPSALGVEW